MAGTRVVADAVRSVPVVGTWRSKPEADERAAWVALLPRLRVHVDVRYRARMEERLGEIPQGGVQRVEVLMEFNRRFARDLKAVDANVESIKTKEGTTSPIRGEYGGSMVLKRGRYERFNACSAYPECRYIKLKEVGLDCPRQECGGRIVERRSRRGRVFFGCSNYPKRDFVTWYRPVAERCPSCGRPYVLEKVTKKDGTTRFCDGQGCGYKKAVNA